MFSFLFLVSCVGIIDQYLWAATPNILEQTQRKLKNPTFFLDQKKQKQINFEAKTGENFQQYKERIENELKIPAQNRFVIGGSEIQNVEAISQSPAILYYYVVSGDRMSSMLRKTLNAPDVFRQHPAVGMTSDQTPDQSTTTRYLVYVANLLNGPRSEGNITYRSGDWTTNDGFSLQESKLRHSWHELVAAFYRWQHPSGDEKLQHDTFTTVPIRVTERLQAPTLQKEFYLEARNLVQNGENAWFNRRTRAVGFSGNKTDALTYMKFLDRYSELKSTGKIIINQGIECYYERNQLVGGFFTHSEPSKPILRSFIKSDSFSQLQMSYQATLKTFASHYYNSIPPKAIPAVPIKQWNLYDDSYAYTTPDEKEVHIFNLKTGEERSIDLGIAEGSEIKSTELKDFVCVNSYLYVWYRQIIIKKKPVMGRGMKEQERVEAVDRIKIFGLDDRSINNFDIPPSIGDTGNRTAEDHFLISKGKIRIVTSVTSGYEVKETGVNEIKTTSEMTPGDNYLKDVVVVSDSTKQALGILFHKAGGVRNVLIYSGDKSEVIRNVDNSDDWSTRFAMSDKWIVTPGLDKDGRSRGDRSVVLRVTELNANNKKSFALPVAPGFKSIDIVGDDAYIFSYVFEQAEGKNVRTLWKLNLKTGEMLTSSFGEIAQEEQNKDRIQVTPEGFYILNDGKLQRYAR